MSINSKVFGKIPDGREVTEFIITNRSGASVSLLNYGAVVRSIIVPDSNGTLGDVTLGFDTLGEYINNTAYIGAVVGRVGNRIGGAKFTLGGKVYELDKNNGEHCLHGGPGGFHSKLWNAEITGENTVRMVYTSRDMEEGYPGKLTVRLDYTFGDDNALTLEYTITTDADTIHNVTHHAYFNLDGHGGGDILGHDIEIDARAITAVSSPASIPTGELRDVDGTVFDLRKPKNIGKMLEKISDDEQMTFGGGYDHNFVLNGSGFRKFAEVTGPVSGRVMTVYTDQPGVQLYTGNMMPESLPGKGGAVYHRRGALCLETQHYPDSINQKDFPSVVLRTGETFTSKTAYCFGVR